MTKKQLTAIMIFFTVIFSGCSTTTSAISIKKAFEYPKSVNMLRSSILEAAEKEEWEIYAPQTMVQSQTLYLRKVIKKRRGYTPKPVFRKKMLYTYVHIAVSYTKNHFEINVTDKHAVQTKEQQVNEMTNDSILQLKDAIYLSLAQRLL